MRRHATALAWWALWTSSTGASEGECWTRRVDGTFRDDVVWDLHKLPKQSLAQHRQQLQKPLSLSGLSSLDPRCPYRVSWRPADPTERCSTPAGSTFDALKFLRQCQGRTVVMCGDSVTHHWVLTLLELLQEHRVRLEGSQAQFWYEWSQLPSGL